MNKLNSCFLHLILRHPVWLIHAVCRLILRVSLVFFSRYKYSDIFVQNVHMYREWIHGCVCGKTLYTYMKNKMECLSGSNRPTELTNTFECWVWFEIIVFLFVCDGWWVGGLVGWGAFTSFYPIKFHDVDSFHSWRHTKPTTTTSTATFPHTI